MERTPQTKLETQANIVAHDLKRDAVHRARPAGGMGEEIKHSEAASNDGGRDETSARPNDGVYDLPPPAWSI